MSYDIRNCLLGNAKHDGKIVLQCSTGIHPSYLRDLQEGESSGRPSPFTLDNIQRQKKGSILFGVHVSIGENDLGNRDLVHLEHCSQSGLREISRCVQAANFVSLFIRELRRRVKITGFVFKSMPSAFLNHVHSVVSMAAKEKMIRPNARRIVACMANQICRLWRYPVANQIPNPMCREILLGMRIKESTVSAAAGASPDPYPAAIFGFIDLFPKAKKVFRREFWQWSNPYWHVASTYLSLKPVLLQQENFT